MVATIYGRMSNGLENFWKRLKNWFTVLSGLKIFSEVLGLLCTRIPKETGIICPFVCYTVPRALHPMLKSPRNGMASDYI